MLFLHFRLSEQAEVHAAIGPVLDKSRNILKAVVLAVLKYKNAVGFKYASLKYKSGQGRQFGQGIRRVGKDEVELLVAALYKAEHIAPQRNTFVGAKFFQALLYEGMVVAVGLHAYYALASSRHQFERYAARAREEVEGYGVFKVYVSVKHIEYVFFCKVRCGSCLERARYVKVASFVYSGNYSHVCCFLMLLLLPVEACLLFVSCRQVGCRAAFSSCAAFAAVASGSVSLS